MSENSKTLKVKKILNIIKHAYNIDIIIQNNDSSLFASQLTIQKKNEICFFKTIDMNFSVKDKLNISFSHKNMHISFKANICGLDSQFYFIKYPRQISYSSDRMLARIKFKESETAHLYIIDSGIRLKIMDISVQGLSFLILNDIYKINDILHNAEVKINSRTSFFCDLQIRHIKKTGAKSYKCGAFFNNIKRKNYNRILKFILPEIHPEFHFLTDILLKDVIISYDNSLSAHPDISASAKAEFKTFFKYVFKAVKSNPENIDIAYIKNGNLISLIIFSRIYAKTFSFEQIIPVRENMLDPKIKTALFSISSEILLAHPDCRNILYLFYEDQKWNDEIFSLMKRIINDKKKFIYEKWHCFEFPCQDNIKTVPEKSSVVISANLTDKDEDLVKYCGSEISALELQICEYGIKRNNSSLRRKIWKLNYKKRTVGFAVADIASESPPSGQNAHSCRIYMVKNQKCSSAVISEILLKCSSLFYKSMKINNFRILINFKNPSDALTAVNNLKYKGIAGRVIMNRHGLSDFRKLINSQFENHTSHYPLSFYQKSIWYMYKLYGDISVWNAAGTIKMYESVDKALFEKALNLFIKSENAVRMKISEDQGVPKQQVMKYKPVKLDYLDFSNIDNIEQAYEWEREKSRQPIKITGSRLFYFALIRIRPDEYWFYAKIHHIITDHWSMSLMCRRILDDYGSLKNNAYLQLKKHPSYSDYVLNENDYKYSEDFIEDRLFWNKRLDLHLDPYNPKITSDMRINPASSRKSFIIPGTIFKKIKECCRQNKISEFVFFSSVLFSYLFRISSNENIIIGTSISNRSRKFQNTFGLFINIIPFIFRVNGDSDFSSQNRLLQEEWMKMVFHKRYPYELMLEKFRKNHDSKNSLNNITLTYHNTKINTSGGSMNYSIRWNYHGSQTEALNIHINDRENKNEFIINYDYLTEIYTEEKIRNMHKNLINLISDGISNPGKKISDLNMLSDKEKNTILFKFNNTSAEFPKDKTVHELFEKQAEISPDAAAVADSEGKMTFRELNNTSNKLAGYIKNNFASDGKGLIGVIIPNKTLQAAAVLAVLKSGNAFVPIDAHNPVLRIKNIIQDAGIKTVISESGQKELINDLQNKKAGLESVIFINDFKFLKTLEQYSADNLNTSSKPSDLCYVIFTSGSTGRPKGVMIKHRSLVNLSYWYIKYFKMTKNDKTTRYSSFGFDASVWELFPPLLCGASVHFIGEEMIYNIDKLNTYLEKSGITICFLPTQIAEKFQKTDNKSLRILQTAGDKLNHFQKNRYILINNYGPTEYTICTTSFKIDKLYSNIPIGKPIANTQIYILDGHYNPVPIGIPGELYISGEGLSDGYINNAVLTEEKFVPNPFSSGRKMYKTGDFAQWKKDGNIEFLGRIDNQIKIRGFRVELNDIEKNLIEYENISKAAVVVRQDEHKNKQLAAYYTSAILIDKNNLKNFISSRLPSYMMPNHFIQLNEFPVSPSGKIDRIKLEQIKIKDSNINKHSSRMTKIEKKMAIIWQKALNIKSINPDANFFDLGGDSLIIIQIISEAFKLNWELNINDFYQYPTIRMLCKIKMSDHPEAKEKNSQQEKIIIPVNYGDTGRISLSGKKHKFNNVLITGGSGYLGSHILNYLAKDVSYSLYCLIRGDSLKKAQTKLQRSLDYYFPGVYNVYKSNKIHVINADISEKNFGVNKKIYDILLDKIDTVYHSAALVKFFGNYRDFEKTNVSGTKNITDFCRISGSKLNYFSTIGISGNNFVRQKTQGMSFSENDFFIGQKYKDNPYVLSKFNAEIIVHGSINSGMHAVIYRIGNLSERYSDGKFQINPRDNWFHLIINTFLKLKILSDKLYDIPIELIPVDFCAKAAVELSKIKENKGKVFHLYNKNLLKFKDFIPLLSQKNKKFKILKDLGHTELINYLLNKNGKNNKLLIPILNEFNYDKLFSNEFNVDIKTDITSHYLNLLGIKWPKIDRNYLKKIINNIINL